MTAPSDPSDLEYRNKFIFNQRGGNIEINNSTDREEVNISQYSGSNISLSNVTNSELASNNKQTKVLYDSFQTVGNTSNEYTEVDRTIRVGENNYEVKGIKSEDEINNISQWVEAYRPLASKNSQFWIKRGGLSFPFPENNSITTDLAGTRSDNPDLSQVRLSVNNEFEGYSKVPEVKSDINEVVTFETVISKDSGEDPKSISPTINDIQLAFGEPGSEAPGIMQFGSEFSSATQDGEWNNNENKSNLANEIVSKAAELLILEQKFGNGGDDIEFIKRNKVQTIGAVLNNYPSIRVDGFGRSQPTEVGVGLDGVFNHKDFVPHVEEVDNSSNFPGGNYNLTVNNKYNVVVGSGGVQIKTSGSLTLGGSLVKIGGTQVNVIGSGGVVIGSSSCIDIYSEKIQLRSTRQIYADGSFGVLNNLIVGGGTFIEGELYVNHITAPIESQETMETEVYGELVPDKTIGFVEILGIGTFPVVSVGTPDSVKIYSHSHHFNNIPLRLVPSNSGIRATAINEEINKPTKQVAALKQEHERKG